MASDDVHDLFGRDGDDESDDPADDERPGDSDESAEWNELSSLEEAETAGDPAVEETVESETGLFERDSEDEAGEFESSDDGDGFASADGADEFEPVDGAGELESTGGTTMSFEEDTEESASPDNGTMFPEDDVGESESEPTTTPTDVTGEDEATEDEGGEDDADGFESTDDVDGFESSASTTSPDPDPDVDEPEPAVSTTSVDGAAEDDVDEPELPESPTSSEGGAQVDEDDEFEPAATTSAEGDVEEDATESESAAAAVSQGDADTEAPHDSESDGSTASADATTADVPGRTASGGATAATDAASSAADLDGSEPASPDSPGRPESTAAGTAVEGVVATESGPNRLPTGIAELDRAMGGGVPPGRLVLLVADPGVQSELIVDSVLAQRDTLYVTTDRPDWEVTKDIEPGIGTGTVEIRDHTPDSLLSGLDSLLDELGTSSNLVLDSVNELELVPRNRYRIFLSDVKRRLFDTGSVGLFTGVTVGHESARDLTLRRADIVLRLETRITDGEIENRLSVPKFRGGAALTETVKLELTDEVRVDTG